MIALSILTKWSIAGLIIVVAMVFLYRSVISPQARDRRRRTRSYGLVVSRKRKTAVRLNAKAPSDKNRDKQ